MRRKDMRRKDIMRKIKVFRRHVFQRPHCSGGNSESRSESKMITLKRNNTNLAKDLSDQKIETAHWYSETIALKGELQELQEKLLKGTAVNMSVENMFSEQEKQIKEYYESINQDFNGAMEKIVEAVEKISKMKQVMKGIKNIMQNCTPGPSNIFSRTPGSRVNLSSSGGSSSPRQRAVPPMVGGQVLQPVSVPLSKLKIDWNDRKRNLFLVREDESNMTTIGEQSSPETNEVIEEQQSLDTEESHQLQNDVTVTPDDNLPEPANSETRLNEDTPRRYSLRCKKISSTNVQATSPVALTVSNRGNKQSRRGRGRGSGRRRSSISGTSKSPLAEEKEVLRSAPYDDPLEGPSWRLDVGRSWFHSRGGRGKTESQNRADVPSVNAGLESSDEDIDDAVIAPPRRRGRPRGCKSRKKVASPPTIPKSNPTLSLDHSCFESPASMRTRLEAFEAGGGRKCRRLEKRKNNLVNSESTEAKGEDVSLRLERDKCVDQQTIPKTEIIVFGVSSPKKMVTEVDSSPDSNKEVSCNPSSAFIYENPGIPTEDNDRTCKIITNMNITMPVSNVIIQGNPATSIEKNVDGLQDGRQSKKKFFKTREMELSKEIQAKGERTPFDISMINESVIEMPPFSSTRTTEKENLPPILAGRSDEYARLCDVSVVLEDVMKSPGFESKTRKELLLSAQKQSQSAKCVSSHTPRKLRSVSRRTLQYTVNYDTDNEEIKKPKRAKKESEFTQNRDLKSITTSSTKPLNGNGNSDIELDESKVFLPDTDTIGKDECFVLMNKTTIHESHTLIKTKSQEVLSGFQQQHQQQPSENRKDPPGCEEQQSSENRKDPQGHEEQQPAEKRKDHQGCEEEVEPASNASPDTLNKSCVKTEINTDYIQKKEEYKKNNKMGVLSDKPENEDCIGTEELCDEQQTLEAEGPHQKHEVAEPSLGFEGFQTSETFKNSQIPKVLASFGNSEKENPAECDAELQNSSEDGGAKENPLGDNCRKRRAVLKIKSFKEASLSIKMRRGETDVTFSAMKKRSRRRPKGKDHC